LPARAVAATVRLLVSNARFVTALFATVLALAPACKRSEPSGTTTPAPALTPDAPQGFGPRLVWFAFRGSSPDAVARALSLHDVGPSTWADGLKGAYGGRVFVTPPIDGWVLAASTRFPDPGDKTHPDNATPAIQHLSQALGEVQYFATYEVFDLQAWARYVNGAPVRKVAYLGADSLAIWADGEPTPEERKLGLVFTKANMTKEPTPSTDNVFAVAGAWSVDPTKLQTRGLPPSLGMMGTPP
jgi:hypothetical protein